MIAVGFGAIAGRRTVLPVRPLDTALREDLVSPSSVFGPLESFALAWGGDLRSCGHKLENLAFA
jgi:hypothetical protein